MKHPDVLALTIEPGFPAPGPQLSELLAAEEEKLDAFACNASETPGTEEFDNLHYSALEVRAQEP